MKNEEKLIYSILGPSTNNIRPFVCAVRAAEEFFSVSKEIQNDFYMIKDIYRKVSEESQQNPKTTARQIQRLANRCWEAMDDEQKMKYIGKKIKDIHRPMELIIYFAFYLHYHRPYYEVIDV